MYKVGGIAFDNYYVNSVELELESCDLTIKIVFHKENVKREKHYKIKTDCNVDINKVIDKLSEVLKDE
jgi:hypothetical protein